MGHREHEDVARRGAWRHENAVLALLLAAIAIPTAIALPLLWAGAFELKTKLTLTLAIVVGSGLLALAARSRVMRPLQTLANLTASLREQDYAVRGRHARGDDVLGLAMTELAALADQLRTERWRDAETAAGLARVVESLDAAVLAVDDTGSIRLANATAERLAGTALDGLNIEDVGLGELLAVEAPRTLELTLGGVRPAAEGRTDVGNTAVGRPDDLSPRDGRVRTSDVGIAGARGTWEVRPSNVRLAGKPHRLFVMTDVQHALRAEERQAWQRLVRVLGHEINNSLGPISSIAETLRTALTRSPRAPDFDDDLSRGLEVIERRAAALARFMQSYARLVRLPPPRADRVDVAAWVTRTVALETRARLAVTEGPPVVVNGDPDQLDQLLINIVRNAVEASAETRNEATGETAGGVRISWSLTGDTVVVAVEDDGPGVSETANLFVPFFTTKPNGSGIGLVLARQIAEAHGGSLVLRSRRDARGAEALITLPLRNALLSQRAS